MGWPELSLEGCEDEPGKSNPGRGPVAGEGGVQGPTRADSLGKLVCACASTGTSAKATSENTNSCTDLCLSLKSAELEEVI